jgi:hypothetical protein
MPEKLPGITKCTSIAEERAMVQVNLLFIYLNVHLHRDIFKIFRIILSQVLNIVITGYEIDFPVQPVEYLYPFSRAAKTEVTKMKDDIIRTNHTIPVGNKCFIHVFYILKWPATEPDDVSMIEVGVGCKEYPASVEFVIHNLFFMRITALVNITDVSSTHGRK